MGRRDYLAEAENCPASRRISRALHAVMLKHVPGKGHQDAAEPCRKFGGIQLRYCVYAFRGQAMHVGAPGSVSMRGYSRILTIAAKLMSVTRGHTFVKSLHNIHGP